MVSNSPPGTDLPDTARDTRGPLRPPWMVAESELRARCTGCGECARACPEEIVARGRGGAPIMHFNGGKCTYCAACAKACPEGLYRLPKSLAPPPRTARIDQRCLQPRNVVCGACIDACPRRAIARQPGATAPRQLAAIVIEAAACNGCGACVGGCPTGAIEITEHPPTREVAA